MLDNRSEAYQRLHEERRRKLEESKGKSMKSPEPNLIVPFNKESPVRGTGKNIEEEITPVKEDSTPKPAEI